MGACLSVVRTRDGELARTLWQFWVNMDCGAICVFLDSMREQVRASRRYRNWTDTKVYERISSGRLRSTVTRLTVEPVPPDDVLAYAIEKVRASVTYQSWETIQAERGRGAIRTRPAAGGTTHE